MQIDVIRAALVDVLTDLGVAAPSPRLELTEALAHGDLSTNVALVYAKEFALSPRALAEKVLEKLPTIEGVAQVAIAGPGFINFFLARTVHAEAISGALTSPDTWGEGALLEGRSIMVEHTQPNPFKVFHIGHLMSNAIGESLVRLFENQRARVIRANYQGDVGPHVAKAIWGVRALEVDPRDTEALGRAYAHGSKAYEADLEAKAQIDVINKAVYEKSDADINSVYDLGRAASLARFAEIYDMLGSTFDRLYFESETAPIGRELVESHPGVFPLSDGARVFPGEKFGLHTRVFITSQGIPTYEAKELGLEHLKEREYPECDEFVITTAVEQKAYFEVVKRAIEEMNPGLAAKLTHIPHGMMRLPTGKMSSRTGDVITGESLLTSLSAYALERAKESRAEVPEVLAQEIAVAAVKFQILRQATGKDALYDEEKALSLEGDSGPYLQYAHARCCSLIEKARESGVTPVVPNTDTATDLERMIARFPLVAMRAAEEKAPQHIVHYLLSIAGMFNAWYANEHILDGTDAAKSKLGVVAAVAATLKNGLSLLGVPAPERM